jgi:hypothetical protein
VLCCQYNFPIYVCAALCFSLAKFLVSLVAVGSFCIYISHLLIPRSKLDCLFCARALFLLFPGGKTQFQWFLFLDGEHPISVVFIFLWKNSCSVALYFSVGRVKFCGVLCYGRHFFFSECGIPLGSAFYIFLSRHLIIC